MVKQQAEHDAGVSMFLNDWFITNMPINLLQNHYFVQLIIESIYNQNVVLRSVAKIKSQDLEKTEWIMVYH